MGSADLTVDIVALFTNTGTDSIPSAGLRVDFYADADESGTVSGSELIDSYICGILSPGDTTAAYCEWNSCSGDMLLFAVAVCPDDPISADDSISCSWNEPGPVTVNEIMYSPSSGNPEWVEIRNSSSVEVQLYGWTLEDSRDRCVFSALTVSFCNPTVSRFLFPIPPPSGTSGRGLTVLSCSLQDGRH